MESAHSPHQPRPDTPLLLLSAHATLSKGGESAHRRKRQSGMNRFSTPTTSQMELAHSPYQPRPDTPLQLLSAHTTLSKGGESVHWRAKQAARGSLFRDCVFYENECSRTQFIFPGSKRTVQHTIYCGCLFFFVYYTIYIPIFQGQKCSFVFSLHAKWRFAQLFSALFVHYFFDISCFRSFMNFFDRQNQQMSQKLISLSVTFCSCILSLFLRYFAYLIQLSA